MTAADRALGVSRQALNNVLNGKAAISAEMALRLATVFGSSAEAWLAMQSAYDLARVRRASHHRLKPLRIAGRTAARASR